MVRKNSVSSTKMVKWKEKLNINVISSCEYECIIIVWVIKKLLKKQILIPIYIERAFENGPKYFPNVFTYNACICPM